MYLYKYKYRDVTGVTRTTTTTTTTNEFGCDSFISLVVVVRCTLLPLFLRTMQSCYIMRVTFNV